MEWTGKVVLVTGASSGIGRQVALDFAQRGARLALVARREDRLQQVADECARRGGQACSWVGDLSRRDFVDGLVGRVVERLGALDVLVNNAGIPKHKHIYHVTPEDLEQTLEVNFMAPARLTLAALPVMLRQGEGFIVNVSSAAGKLAPPRETVYAASKFALTGFSEGLCLDLEGSGIHSVVIHVGPIDTEIWDKAASEAPVAYRGVRYPPSLVSDALFRCLEQRRHEVTVPGRLRLVFWLKSLLPGWVRRGNARFDPVPPEVVEEARRAAGS